MAAQSPAKKKNRITLMMAGLLVITAIVFDGVQVVVELFNLIPIAGPIIATALDIFIGAVAQALFFVWFAVLGVKFSGRFAAQKMLIVLASCVVELVPYLDALPAITFGVVSLIIVTRIEDAGMSGLDIMNVVSGTARVTGALGIPGARIASRALALRRSQPEEDPPTSPRGGPGGGGDGPGQPMPRINSAVDYMRAPVQSPRAANDNQQKVAGPSRKAA